MPLSAACTMENSSVSAGRDLPARHPEGPSEYWKGPPFPFLQCANVFQDERRLSRRRPFPGTSPWPSGRLRPSLGEHLSAHAYVEVFPGQNDRGGQAGKPDVQRCTVRGELVLVQRAGIFLLGRIEAGAFVASGLPGCYHW